MLKNKRGQSELLTEETLKLLIGLLCVSLLVYGVYYVLTNSSVPAKVKEAESSDNLILGEINRVNAGGEGNLSGILVPNPAGWFIFSFIEGDLKPNSCYDENCLCICEEAVPAWFDWQEKRCDEKGFCVSVTNLKKFEKIKIENSGIWISVDKVNDEIILTRK